MLRHHLFALFFLSAICLSGCGNNSEPDLIAFNGNVLTMAGQNPGETTIVSAFAIKNGNFSAVGSDAQIKALAGNKTERLDLQGRTVVPGFNDAHMHPLAMPSQAIDLSEIDSMAQLQNRLSQALSSQHPRPYGWLIGMSYDDTRLGRHPNREDLDKISTQVPILLLHASMHLCAVNSVALNNAGVNHDTQDPPGGKLFRDKSGQLSGLISERPALELLFNEQQPQPFPHDLASVLDGLEAFYPLAHSLGITSYGDALVPPELALGYLLSDPQTAGMRVNLMFDGEKMPAIQYFVELNSLLESLGLNWFSSPWLRAKTVKLFHGMSLSGRTARQFEHYHGRPNYFGEEPQRGQAELNALIEEVHQLGMQAAVHSNGDYEVDMVLKAIAAANASAPREHRHRIEHGSIVNENILQRMAEQDVVYAPHSYIYEKGPMIEPYGALLWPRMFANKSAFDYGIVNAANSDYPVSALPPLLRIQSLLSRRSRAGKVYGPEQRLSIEQALWAYTMGGAYATFEERYKGSIETGKYADFVVLAEHPGKVEEDKIKDIKILATYVDGIKRYQASAE
ncbi:MAG: amidohydrolase [Cellvibrionaceae bacterium]|nr:amidohydrolase [Cellvibrionaceae bacterium]